MAKYEIKRTCCGTTEVVNITGPVKNRQGRADWIARQECEVCARKRRDDFNARNAAANAESGFVALIGSAKQIAWAETIRAQKIQEARDWLESLARHPQELAPMMALRCAFGELTSISSAPAWIDGRDRSGRELLAATDAWKTFFEGQSKKAVDAV